MASQIATIIAKRALKDKVVPNINATNPYEERVEVTDRNGRPTGKFKKLKRRIPDGLSENDRSVLKRVRSRAYHLDMSLFNCCGIRAGWSSVIGIIPVIGDFIDCFMALMLVRKCEKIDGGLPATLQSRMYFNVMIDFAVGLVPILGDLADVLYRANTRNAWLLEGYLVKKRDAEAAGQVTDPDSGKVLPTAPRPARLQSSSGGGIFGLGRNRQPDEEMGAGRSNGGGPRTVHPEQTQQVRNPQGR